MDEVRGTPFAVAAVRPVRNNTSTSPIAFPMSETPTPEVRANESIGHLSVHVEGAHPVEIPFLFEQQQKRMGPAVVVSFASHLVFAVFLIFAIRYGTTNVTSAALLPEQPNANIIWLSQPGPGGGGGGGGNQMKEPPRQAEMPGKDRITVPVSKPPKLEMQEVKKEPDPVAQLDIPAKSLASAQDSLPGAIEAPPGPPTLSQGSGSGGGAGTGRGSGIGPGTGSGLGPGSGGGTGGGVYRPGNGVTLPRVLHEERPRSRRTRCAPRSRGRFSSSASFGLTAASATCRWSARSTRPSASTGRRSPPPANGDSPRARGSANQYQC